MYDGAARRSATSPSARRTRDRSTIVVTVPDNWQDTIDVNVLPNGAVEGESDTDGDGSDGLPDTGGPPRWLAALGALLVLGGAQLVRRPSDRTPTYPLEPARLR